MQLSDLKIGEKAKVVGFVSGSKIYRQKLLAMGLTPGTMVMVRRIAPLGDPLELTVRGFALSVRKQEAQCLQVERELP